MRKILCCSPAGSEYECAINGYRYVLAGIRRIFIRVTCPVALASLEDAHSLYGTYLLDYQLGELNKGKTEKRTIGVNILFIHVVFELNLN
jgi:hypothetical protein